MQNGKQFAIALLAGVVCTSAGVVTTAASSFTLEPVALRGEQAADVAGQQFYSTFQLPFVTDGGQAVFRATKVGPDALPGSFGIWCGTSDHLRSIVQFGDVVAQGGGTFSSVQSMSGGGDGVVNFLGGVTGGGRGGIFASSPTFPQPRAIARGQDVAPGTDGQSVYGAFQTPTTSSTGQASIAAGLDGTLTPQGLWIGTPGDVRLQARVGSPIGEPPRTLFDLPQSSTGASLNKFEQLAFVANVAASDGQRIYAGTAGAFKDLARITANAPGTANKFTSLNTPLMNDAGYVTFGGRTDGPLVGGAQPDGSWIARLNPAGDIVGPTQLIAIEGAQAPDAPAGATFALFSGTRISADGPAVAFKSFIAGGGVQFGVNDSGIWTGTPGDLHLAVQNGDPVPEMAGHTFQNLSQAWVNDDGIVVFVGGTTVGSGVFGSSPAHQPFSIAAPGDEIQIGLGDVRTISSANMLTDFSSGAGSTGLSSPFSGNGDLTLLLSFTDGTSGVFLTHVPEPTFVASLLILGISLAARRRTGR